MSTIKVTNIQSPDSGTNDIIIDADGHVQIDGQQLPTAGPLSNRNLIINGAMQVAQRSTSETGVGASFVYTTVDRFTLRNSGSSTARYTNTQSSDAPDNFGYSYKLEVTTAKGTLSTTNYQGVATRLEGQNLQNLGYGTGSSKYLTLSFWVKSNTTGQYSCHFSNWNASRNISKTYTINSANTWEQKSITIPGDSIAIADDNALGMEIGWVLASGSFYNDGTDGSSWHSTTDSGKRHSGQSVEFGGTIGDTWYLSGVQLEVGEKATPFEHRSYGQELALCQRYYQKFGGTNFRLPLSRFTASAGEAEGVLFFKSTMRSSPTFTQTGTWSGSSGFAGAPTSLWTTAEAASVRSSTTPPASGVVYLLAASADTFVIYDAEL